MSTEHGHKYLILSPERCRLLVYGYMRLKFDTDKCPGEIIELCLGWYLMRKDEWNPNYIPEGVELNGDCVELKTKDGGIFAYKTVVGSYQYQRQSISKNGN